MIKSSYKRVAANLLIGFNVFIIFFLLFGNHIVIPVWLQPLGRLHPLILHFPIVLLIMAMVLEFFRFTPRFKNELFYQDLTSLLWLIGVLLAAITAIMGLFLSKEPGYDGGAVAYHKWFGVLVVFVSTFLYRFRDEGWYGPSIARYTSMGMVLCLIVAGHLGSDITHGDNFILAPVWHPEQEKVPIEKALVFRDVVEPVFESKCNSCHNAGKTKGGLMLTDESSVLKGGKDGKLFIAGQPQLSLVLKRIHLPQEEKDHMPPSGKPQLTADELDLLYLWVKENAGPDKKVLDLPATDSLRMIAATFLKPADAAEEKFDFAAADEQTIKKLNNNYRVIYPVAQGSPALAVNIYNKATYQPKILEELGAIKKQVITLDLGKMPVKDAELKTIAGFENLHTLNLNFTDVTGATLKDLSPLKHLQSLSLAGTPLNPAVISQISAIKSLVKVALWDTGLPAEELVALQKNNKGVEIITGYKDDGKPIKLNTPQLKNTQQVFTKPFALLLSHPIKGVDIRYTTDGTDPDSTRSLLYRPGTIIAENTLIKAKAYKPGWLGSDVVQFNFYKSAYTPDSISFLTAPDIKYSGDGPKTLIDKELGGGNFGNGKWIASQKDLAIYMQFKQAAALHTVTVNCLRNMGSQIFLPVELEVWGGADITHLKLLSTVRPPKPLKDDPFVIKGVECKLSVTKPIACLKIIAKPLQTLPPWDAAKNQPGWVFMDEIFLN